LKKSHHNHNFHHFFLALGVLLLVVLFSYAVLTPELRKNIKSTGLATGSYEILSDGPTSPVEVGKEVSFLLTLSPATASSSLEVDLPKNAHDIQVYAVNAGGSKKEIEKFTAVSLADKTVVTLEKFPKQQIEIEYKLAGPTKKEQVLMMENVKNIFLSSEYPYKSVGSKTNINLPKEEVRVKRLKTGEIVPDISITREENNIAKEVSWIVPEIGAEEYSVTLASSTESGGGETSLLPGWQVQARDGCIGSQSWVSSPESLSGNPSVMYTPAKDQADCTLLLPPFEGNKEGVIGISFYLKANFTNPETYLEFSATASENCGFNFNGNSILQTQGDCTVSMDSAENGWKKITLTRLYVASPQVMVEFSLSPPFSGDTFEEPGTILFDNFKADLPS